MRLYERMVVEKILCGAKTLGGRVKKFESFSEEMFEKDDRPDADG